MPTPALTAPAASTAAAAAQQSSGSADPALQNRLGKLQLATQLVQAVLESPVDNPKKVDTMSKIVSQALGDADLLTAAAAAAGVAATVDEAAAAGAAAVSSSSSSSTAGSNGLQQQVQKLRLDISQMHHVLSSGDSCDAKLQWLSARIQV